MKKAMNGKEFFELVKNPKNIFTFIVNVYNNDDRRPTKLICNLDAAGHFVAFNYSTLKTITDDELHDIIENGDRFIISYYATVEQQIRARMRLIDQFIHSEIEVSINSSIYTNLGDGNVMVDCNINTQEPITKTCCRMMDLNNDVYSL